MFPELLERYICINRIFSIMGILDNSQKVIFGDLFFPVVEPDLNFSDAIKSILLSNIFSNKLSNKGEKPFDWQKNYIDCLQKIGYNVSNFSSFYKIETKNNFKIIELIQEESLKKKASSNLELLKINKGALDLLYYNCCFDKNILLQVLFVDNSNEYSLADVDFLSLYLVSKNTEQENNTFIWEERSATNVNFLMKSTFSASLVKEIYNKNQALIENKLFNKYVKDIINVNN